MPTLNSVLDSAWRILRVVARSMMYTFTVLVCGLFLASALSPYIPPVRLVTVAFLGLAFPIFLALQLGITLYWLIRRQWYVVLGLVVVWAVGWTSVAAYLPLNRTTPDVEERRDGRIKILSYNVAAFGFVHHTDKKPNPILQYIKSSGADIVCLQEAMVSDTSWGTVSSRQIRQFLRQEYPYVRFRQAPHRGTTLILLSKFPIESAELLPLESRANGGVRYTLYIDGRRITLFNLHLESFRLKRHDEESYIELARSGNAFGLQEELRSKMGPAYRRRNIQANLVRTLIDSTECRDVIVCGDFNDTPVSYAYRKLRQGLRDAFADSGSGFGFTYMSGLFVVRIDHILLGSSFVPERTFVDYSITTSDHYPVTTYVRWADKD